MKRGFAVPFLAVSLAMGQAAPAQKPGRIVTTTRLVTIFSELEEQLSRALQGGDQAALDRLLGEDFQVWKPMSDPVPREDWIQQAQSGNLTGFRPQHMAVMELGENTSIASFVLTQTSGKHRERYFVVDVWQKTAAGWQVTNRYLSHMQDGSAAPADRRPTGRN